MGTRFRTMLAPINASTGDGRRFAEGGISLADLPFPFEWARSREGGHDGAVVVGAVQEAAVLSVADAIAGDWISADAAKGMNPEATGVWARGELFDAVDREQMPRLAEDVAEAMHLMSAGTLGPSVDLDSFEGVPVAAGTDEPLVFGPEDEDPEGPIELLITKGRVRAATLVSIPAFAETCRPLELIAEDADALAVAASENPDIISESAREMYALVASVGVGLLPGAGAFALPSLSGPTPITYDYETGRVFGHIATWKTCHVGYEGVCITPPREDESFSWFNRFPVETTDGTVWAGRITAGGRHAGLSLTANSAMSHYDDMTTVAHVRAYADEHGIAVAGVLSGELDEGTRAVLSRRKVSGDWRETPGGLTLVEVLALSPGPRAHSEPGFPVETFSRGGRQVALTASLSPEPESERLEPIGHVDVEALAAALERRQAARTARASLAAMVESEAQARRVGARAELAAAIQEV